MKYRMTAIGLVLFTGLLLFSCSKDNGGDGNNNSGGNNNGGSAGGGTTTTPGPLFTSVRSIIQTNCAVSGCHTGTAAQNGINFSVDNTIVAQKERIKVRAVDQAGTASQMPAPPNPTLSSANQQAITTWIAAGGRITD